MDLSEVMPPHAELDGGAGAPSAPAGAAEHGGDGSSYSDADSELSAARTRGGGEEGAPREPMRALEAAVTAAHMDAATRAALTHLGETPDAHGLERALRRPVLAALEAHLGGNTRGAARMLAEASTLGQRTPHADQVRGCHQRLSGMGRRDTLRQLLHVHQDVQEVPEREIDLLDQYYQSLGL